MCQEGDILTERKFKMTLATLQQRGASFSAASGLNHQLSQPHLATMSLHTANEVGRTKNHKRCVDKVGEYDL